MHDPLLLVLIILLWSASFLACLLACMLACLLACFLLSLLEAFRQEKAAFKQDVCELLLYEDDIDVRSLVCEPSRVHPKRACQRRWTYSRA